MGWFSKKEEVPEVSHVPELPDLPKKEGDKGLPELPHQSVEGNNENHNQEMVKSAVKDAPSPEGKEARGGARPLHWRIFSSFKTFRKYATHSPKIRRVHFPKKSISKKLRRFRRRRTHICKDR